MEKIQFIPEEDLHVVPVPFAALSQTQHWGMALAAIQNVWTITKGTSLVGREMDWYWLLPCVLRWTAGTECFDTAFINLNSPLQTM